MLLSAMAGIGSISPAGALDVLINEVAWSGTQADASDEWIELYNPGVAAIDLTGWSLSASDGTPTINLMGTIPAGGYFLLERTADTTISDIPADQVYTGALNDAGETLQLFDQTSNLIDTANQDGGGWPAGTSGAGGRRSMERAGVFPDSDAGWSTNDGVTRNGSDAGANPLNGTPKQPNSSLAPYAPQMVVISEIAWYGTRASAFDEWVELYNPGSTAIILAGWKLEAADGDPSISLSGSIAGNGYYLLERSDGRVTDVAENLVYAGGLLSDTGETLFLLAPDRSVIDTANAYGGAWPAGGGAEFAAMERIKSGGVIEPDSPFAWMTNEGVLKNGQDAAGNDIYGTPGQENWAFSVLPTPSPTATHSPTPVGALTLLINEVAWAGTLASAEDEWIELYNPGGTDIDLTGWVLSSSDGSPDIPLSGTVLAGDYFLMERTDEDTLADIQADLIYSGSLSNSGETLRLYSAANDLIDTANSNGGAWPAGNASAYASMQRSVAGPDSDYVWVSYDAGADSGTKAKDASGNDIRGTPGRENRPINVTPTPTVKASGSTSATATPSPAPGPAPILGISEFLPRPGSDWNNDGVVNVGDEFVEIINAGRVDVNLKGYRLDDEPDRGAPPFSLPDLTLKPGERAVFYASETGILLSDAGDTVRLLTSRGGVVDAYTYGVARYPDQSWCRIPDRLGYWNKPCIPTPGNPNALTGRLPFQDGAMTAGDPPACLLPDTTPEEFVIGECLSSGGRIWNRQYWDEMGGKEKRLLDGAGKWEATLQ